MKDIISFRSCAEPILCKGKRRIQGFVLGPAYLRGGGHRKPGLFCAEAPAPAAGSPAQRSGRAARRPASDRALRRRARPRAARASSPRVGEPWNPQRGGRGARLGPELRRGRRLPRGALKTSLVSEDKPPHLQQPGGRAPAGPPSSPQHQLPGCQMRAASPGEGCCGQSIYEEGRRKTRTRSVRISGYMGKRRFVEGEGLQETREISAAAIPQLLPNMMMIIKQLIFVER